MVAEPENDGPDLAEETDDLQRALTPVQERAIIALLNEQTITGAAAAAEVGQRTLYRWLRQPEFSRAYREARREAFGAGRLHLRSRLHLRRKHQWRDADQGLSQRVRAHP